MAVLETLLEITMYSAVIFTAIMLVKVCFKNKISPVLQYAVWGIFLLRLMIPLSFQSPLHLFTLPAGPAAATEESVQYTQNDTLDFLTPSSGVYVGEQKALDSKTSNIPAQSAGQGEAPAIKQAIRLTLPQILLAIWLSGTAVCLCYFTALAVLLKRKLKNKKMPPPARLLTLIWQVKDELGIRADIKAICQDGYGTPALLFPRTVFLPIRTLSAMDDEQIRNCLRHEFTHYKRGDQFVNLLLLILNAVYWFNPLVWLSFFQIRKDMESACDSAVVRNMDTSARRDYATLILGMLSQAKHRQVALGMARGSTRKAAEQRIKGIFMKSSSGKSARFMAAALAIVLFVCCFTTACQPTPETPAVIGKQDGLSELIQSTQNVSNGVFPTAASSPVSDELYAKLGAPKHWSLEETALDGKLNITADADIKLPGVSQLPAATASLSEFTQQDLDKIANVLVGEGAAWTEVRRTKEEIEDQILETQAELSEAKAKDNTDPPMLVEHLEDMIENMEQQYNEAPYQSELKNVDYKIGRISYGHELNGDAITGAGFEGLTEVSGQPFYFYAGGMPNSDSVRKIQTSFGSGPAWFGGAGLIDKPYGISLTKEQAAAQATDIAKQLTDELTLCCVAPAATFKQNTSRNWGWACVFMREVNGCPTAYEQTEIGSDIETTVNEPVPYEKMVIVMDDIGMTSFEWESPMKVESVDNPDVPLQPFEDISQRAKEQIAQLWAYEVANKKDNNGVDWSDPGCTANITNVELGLMRIAKPGGDDYYYIPVWNFFSALEHTPEYEKRFLDAFGDEALSQDDYVDKDGNPNSGMTDGFLQWGGPAVTINALDGSVIDRNLGY